MTTASSGSGRLRLGVVGLGRLGKRHAENLAYRVPGASLVAACSPVEEERAWAREALPEPRLYDDYAALLADRDVDAVWLVTPSSLHAQQIIDALRAGKHVFCEKPLSLDIAECERVLAEAARHPHLLATIGFMRRFDPSYKDAFDKIQSGAIGRPFLVRSQTTDKNDEDGFLCVSRRLLVGFFWTVPCTISMLRVGCLGSRVPSAFLPRARLRCTRGCVSLATSIMVWRSANSRMASLRCSMRRARRRMGMIRIAK